MARFEKRYGKRKVGADQAVSTPANSWLTDARALPTVQDGRQFDRSPRSRGPT